MSLQLSLAAILLFFLSLQYASGAPEFSLANSQNTETKSQASATGSIHMTDREKAGIRGPVRTCVEEYIYPNDKFLTTTEYSLDGRLLTTRHSNPDGSEWVTTQTYDSDGRLVKTASGKSGEPVTESLYAYDEAGRLLTITNSTENGGRADFSYDGQGRKATIQTFDPKTIQRAQNTAFAGSPWNAAVSAGIGVPVGGNILTIYNANDQPTEAQLRDGQGRIVSRIVRSYDANGRIIEENQIQENPALFFADQFGAEGRPQPTAAQLEAVNRAMKLMQSGRNGTGTTYTYDDQGHVTEMRERNFVVDKVTTTSYNEHGDKSAERETMTDNSTVPAGVPYSVDENGTLVPDPAAKPTELPDFLFDEKEVRYAYQYDSYGNWTQQTVNYRSLPDEPSNVRHRKLTYY